VGISVFVKDEITEVTKDITVNLNNLVDPPIAVINSDKIGGKAPFWMSFSAIESRGIDADIISWEWNFGDETLGLAKNFVKQYKIPGNYEVILNVKDKNGNVGTKSVKVIVE
jgi:PKD repeat protein